MSGRSLESEATKAFKSPTKLTAQRFGPRIASPTSYDQDADSVSSARSRRSPSLISSPREADLFDQMSHANSVKIKKNRIRVTSPPSQGMGSPPTSPMSEMYQRIEESFKGVQQGAAQVFSFANHHEPPPSIPSLALGDAKLPPSQTHRMESNVSNDDNDLKKQSSGSTNSSSGWEKVDPSEAGPPRDGPNLHQTPQEPGSNIQQQTLPTDERSLSSFTQTSRLDFQNNDNSFHVVASLLVEFFLSKLSGTILNLDAKDREEVIKLLPASAHQDFVEAVRLRLQDIPENPHTPIQILTNKCRQLGMEREGTSNPITFVMSLQEGSRALNITRESSFLPDSGSLVGAQQTIDASNTGSTITNDTSKEMVRRRIGAEINEASNLMTASVTPETTAFWKNHIDSLQKQLDRLDGESIKSNSSIPAHMDSIEPLSSHDKSISYVKTSPLTITDDFPPNSVTDGRDKAGKHPELEASNLTKENVIVPQYGPSNASSPEDEYEYPEVDVVAPADLPGGYHFEAEIEGQRFLATVPHGGVQQGETFTCVMRELGSVQVDIPVGYWKDDLVDFCKYGCCHPVFWNSIFCPLIALGQISTRVNLDFLGRPREINDGIPNRRMMLTVTFFWMFLNIGILYAYFVKWSRGLELTTADLASFGLANVAMFGFIVFVAQSTRGSLRDIFMIREQRCHDLEDLVCATFCLPCTICQMSRHTANYDDYEAVCCSKTGLPDGVRMNIQEKKEFGNYVV